MGAYGGLQHRLACADGVVQVSKAIPQAKVDKPDMKVEMRTVVLGRTVGNELSLTSGVQPGETVVTDGQSRLVPGAEVQVSKTGAGGNQ